MHEASLRNSWTSRSNTMENVLWHTRCTSCCIMQICVVLGRVNWEGWLHGCLRISSENSGSRLSGQATRFWLKLTGGYNKCNATGCLQGQTDVLWILRRTWRTRSSCWKHAVPWSSLWQQSLPISRVVGFQKLEFSAVLVSLSSAGENCNSCFLNIEYTVYVAFQRQLY